MMKNQRKTPALRPASRGKQEEAMERVLAPSTAEPEPVAVSKPTGKVETDETDPWVHSTLRMRSSTRRLLRTMAAETDTTMQEIFDRIIRDWLDRQH
ncbi:hypothetical protein [Bifidobacterium simiarum]|uniref:hypothetical protein n=1 Tax=Bifidobacterium simiarum TaxID=2045441 RepID=UPI001BDD8C34|nr:hypothetical protein [Bifidobacterium simiarum]MBT1167316.1 hypothetical protein [Bifidobacterium simiarum]